MERAGISEISAVSRERLSMEINFQNAYSLGIEMLANYSVFCGFNSPSDGLHNCERGENV